MDKELVELFEAAKKAADAASAAGASSGGPEETRCLDALKQLKVFPVTYQVLVSSQVGKRLRYLTKHPSRKIQASASDLIEIWKNVIIEETARNKKCENTDTGNSIKLEPVNSKNSHNKEVQDGTSIKVEKAEAFKVDKIERDGMERSEKNIKSETVNIQNRISANVENGGGFKVEKIERNGMERSEKVIKSGSVNVQNGISVKVEKGEAFKIEKIEQNGMERSEKVIKSETVKVQKVGERKNNEENHPVARPKLTSMLKCGDAMRDKVREFLFEPLAKVESEVYDEMKDEVRAYDPIRVAVSVESVMFERWGRSNGSQKSKYRSIIFNIKDPNNPDFRRKVLLGQVKPEELTTMNVEEMGSDQRQFENAKIKEKALFECERGQPAVASTNEFRCGRCGKRECNYYQMQIRSADEPMTTFVTCCNCNKRWKFC